MHYTLMGVGFTIWLVAVLIFIFILVTSLVKYLIDYYFEQKEAYYTRLASVPGTDEFSIKNVH